MGPRPSIINTNANAIQIPSVKSSPCSHCFLFATDFKMKKNKFKLKAQYICGKPRLF